MFAPPHRDARTGGKLPRHPIDFCVIEDHDSGMNRPAGEGEATALLQAWSEGDRAADDRLMALRYAGQHGFDVLAVDELLTRLAGFDARKSRVIELRYFGGLSLEETAQVLQISRATVYREWRTARTRLHQELTDGA